MTGSVLVPSVLLQYQWRFRETLFEATCVEAVAAARICARFDASVPWSVEGTRRRIKMSRENFVLVAKVCIILRRRSYSFFFGCFVVNFKFLVVKIVFLEMLLLLQKLPLFQLPRIKILKRTTMTTGSVCSKRWSFS